MENKQNQFFIFLISIVFLCITSCNRVLPWTNPPVIPAPIIQSNYIQPESKSEVMKQIVGHYAHYDVVSYGDNSGREPVRSFIITYGFTDFFQKDGQLFEKDTFLHAENKLNQTSVSSHFSDEATRAIKSRTSIVQISYINSTWKIHRPSTPTLLGFKGDFNKTLPENIDVSLITDPDMDSHPGVTVNITIFGFIKAELYIIRREIFEYNLQMIDNNTLYGNVIDKSEQHIIGATMKELTESTKPLQHSDKDMSQILLKRIPEDIDTWEELKAVRDELFPAEPDFK